MCARGSYLPCYILPFSTPPYRVKCFRQAMMRLASESLLCAYPRPGSPESSLLPSRRSDMILAISFAYRPQRASSAMSTIGEKVQLMPSALASLADISPTFFIARYPMSRRGREGWGTSFRNHESRPYLRAAGCPDGCSDGDFCRADLVEPFDIENSAHVAWAISPPT